MSRFVFSLLQRQNSEIKQEKSIQVEFKNMVSSEKVINANMKISLAIITS